ncbi:MAG TPA: tetratricopeptide repeat protein [Acidobacteriota bacterium]|nr:tetratricopeptide repeat protein [Acidobacteriota bacterium]
MESQVRTWTRRHQDWFIPLLLLIVSFTVRLVYLNQVQTLPTVANPIMDERYHLELAEKINSETGMDPEPFFRAPLYPYFFAAVYRMTGYSLYWSRLLQILLGSFLPLLVLALGLRLFGRSVAYWAAGLAALYPSLIYYDASLLITSIMTILTTLLIWQLYRSESNPRLLNFVLSGALLGLAALARPNILLLGPVLIVWIWLVIKPVIGLKKAIIGYVAIGVAALIVILPVTVRNYAVSRDLVFISWQGGYNLFVGNNREANGWSATVPGVDPTWQGGYDQSIAMAEAVAKRPLKRSEVADFWYGMAWQEISRSPGRFVGLLWHKLRLFVNGYEIPNNQNVYLVRDYSLLIRPLMFTGVVYFPYGLLAPLAVIGIVLSLGRWRQHLLLYLLTGSYLLTLLLFFVCARFRQPLIPVLLLFAVYAVHRAAAFARRRQGKNLVLFLFFFALLAWESNHNLLGLRPDQVRAEDMFVLGTSYAEQNDMAKAESYFRGAVGVDSTHARAWLNLGYIHSQRGKNVPALRCFQRALALDPNNADAHINYATALEIDGRTVEGALILERARLRFPFNSNIHMKLAASYHQLGRPEDAKASIQESLRLNPHNARARQIYDELFKTDEQ